MGVSSVFVRMMGVLLLCMFGVCPTVAAQPPSDKLLTVSDIEKVTSLKGIRLVPQDRAGMMGGDLYFKQQDGKLLLTVQFWDMETFEAGKSGFPYKVDGLADEAFEGPVDSTEHGDLVFRKGDRAVLMSSELDSKTNKPLVSGKPLRELAKIIASRM